MIINDISVHLACPEAAVHHFGLQFVSWFNQQKINKDSAGRVIP